MKSIKTGYSLIKHIGKVLFIFSFLGTLASSGVLSEIPISEANGLLLMKRLFPFG
jgi:hypothetical protein